MSKPSILPLSGFAGAEQLAVGRHPGDQAPALLDPGHRRARRQVVAAGQRVGAYEVVASLQGAEVDGRRGARASARRPGRGPPSVGPEDGAGRQQGAQGQHGAGEQPATGPPQRPRSPVLLQPGRDAAAAGPRRTDPGEEGQHAAEQEPAVVGPEAADRDVPGAGHERGEGGVEGREGGVRGAGARPRRQPDRLVPGTAVVEGPDLRVDLRVVLPLGEEGGRVPDAPAAGRSPSARGAPRVLVRRPEPRAIRVRLSETSPGWPAPGRCRRRHVVEVAAGGPTDATSAASATQDARNSRTSTTEAATAPVEPALEPPRDRGPARPRGGRGPRARGPAPPSPRRWSARVGPRGVGPRPARRPRAARRCAAPCSPPGGTARRPGRPCRLLARAGSISRA